MNENDIQENADSIDTQDSQQIEAASHPAADENGNEYFTREEMDMIISKRMKAEQTKVNALLEQLELQYKEKEFKLYARDTIINNGLSPELLECLNSTDEHSLSKAIQTVNSIIEKKVQEEVDRRLVGKSPAAGGTQKTDNIRRAWGMNR